MTLRYDVSPQMPLIDRISSIPITRPTPSSILRLIVLVNSTPTSVCPLQIPRRLELLPRGRSLASQWEKRQDDPACAAQCLGRRKSGRGTIWDPPPRRPWAAAVAFPSE